jgi:chemotaxis protein MotB
MPGAARSRRSVPDIWPGFVDAISALLIIVIFLVMVFTLAQYFLGELLSGRDNALERLNRQVAELGEMLALERSANIELRNDMSQISAELQSSVAAREDLLGRVATLTAERDALEADRDQLGARIDALVAERDDLEAGFIAERARAEEATAALEETNSKVEADREQIILQIATIESLRRDIAALSRVRDELEEKVGTLAAALEERDRALGAERDRSKALSAELATEKERTQLSQQQIDTRDVRIESLSRQLDERGEKLTEAEKISAEARQRIALLNRQMDALRQQLARLATALEASEAKAKEQGVQIANLGSRLNAALASKVEELARYRSEFFGRLREALGNRQDIRIVGDRFVFQSEVLFDSGSAEFAEGGRAQIAKLAETLKEIAAKIPNDIDWILRIDGHTDERPIATSQFPSNWELSTARAISVVKQLVTQGIPAQRLVAAGFGEYHPIDKGRDEVAYRRNRRIEFKLTGR